MLNNLVGESACHLLDLLESLYSLIGYKQPTDPSCRFQTGNCERNMVQVTKVEYMYNATLRERFSQKKAEFKKLKTPYEETIVFHKATADATNEIAFQGFHGGDTEVYTNFNPEFQYVGRCTDCKPALLCLALIGNAEKVHSNLSYAKGKLSACTTELLLKSGDQLLPKYIVHFTDLGIWLSKRNCSHRHPCSY